MSYPSSCKPAPLTALRRNPRNAWISHVLVLLLLVQGLIPIQSHTRLAVTDDGQVVQLCTLEGMVQVTIQLDTDPSETPHQGDRTAAMLFSLLLGETVASDLDVRPAWLALPATPNTPDVIGAPAQRMLRLASIRAPPVLV